MKRFVFREDLADRHLEQRIWKSLEIQRLVSFEELCQDADAPAGAVHALLDVMIERREVERLRPLRYEKDDLDYFLLREAQSPFGAPALNRRRFDSRRGWLDRIQLNLKPPRWVRYDKQSLKSLA